MWCLVLSVECRKSAEFSQLNPDEALQLSATIATDVFARLVLNLPKLGLPGETPHRESFDVTIDGVAAELDHSRHADAGSVMVFAPTVVGRDEQAARGDLKASRARAMVAEAGYQVLFNSKASEVTAIVVAASACEVHTHRLFVALLAVVSSFLRRNYCQRVAKQRFLRSPHWIDYCQY